MIVMQIEEAMKYDKALVIISPAANHERIELLTQPLEFLNTQISLKNFVSNPDLGENPDAFIRSVNASVFDHERGISDKVKKTLLTNIPFGFYKHIDKWALFYALSQLKKKQKNFLFIETVVTPVFQILSHEELVDIIGEEHIIARDLFRYQFYINKLSDTTFDDPGYHTLPVCQEISAYILKKIIDDRYKK